MCQIIGCFFTIFRNCGRIFRPWLACIQGLGMFGLYPCLWPSAEDALVRKTENKFGFSLTYPYLCSAQAGGDAHKHRTCGGISGGSDACVRRLSLQIAEATVVRQMRRLVLQTAGITVVTLMHRMEIHELLQLYARSAQCEALATALEDTSLKTVFVEGLVASAAAVLFASAKGRTSHPVVFILNDAEEAGYFYHDLTQMMGTDRVLFFPSSYRRGVKYGQREAANEVLRTEVLASLTAAEPQKMAAGDALYIVTHPEAVAELVVSKKKMDERSLRLQVGDLHDISELEADLHELGFTEVDYVYEPGQYAVRGSIVDVFSYSNEYPFRIDFFGDEVDSIRLFNVQDQLSKEKRQQADIVPQLSNATEKMPLLQFLPADSILVAKDFLFVRDVVDRTFDEGFSAQAITERTEGLTEVEQQAVIDEMKSEQQLISGRQFTEQSLAFRRVEIGQRPTGRPDATIRVQTALQPLFHKNFDLLRQTLSDFHAKHYLIYILADSQKQQERLREILAPDDPLSAPEGATNAYAHKSNEVPSGAVGGTSGASEAFIPVDKTLHEGFIDHKLRLCLFTDHQIFDRFHKYSLRSDAARTGKMALTMKDLMEMEPGDYVVHIDLGVGRFAGLVRVPLPPPRTGYQEVIRIIYANNDKVDVSIHSLYKISKYKRKDVDAQPRLSTLGTGAWDRMKERTKNKIKDIARDLIRLYAARRRENGFAFSPDSFMQHELEASFLYEDTPDQLKATNDVKADMEQARPMDRLVCGDVGFGKTEVAIRAAFKAACDSKQVAVMVPTTVLAYQHYQTFTSRLKGMPVRVDYLSRARSAKKTKEILADLAEGKIDIIIGTHKLIGKTVKFRDLGLLIIDEEQKFGVAVKEKLRQMKVSVDTLTMSATPIPRTLQFSLMGARDMSIIQTPPPNRYPIQTEIVHLRQENSRGNEGSKARGYGNSKGGGLAPSRPSPLEPSNTNSGWQQIAEAINFEMSRNGQVFFVNDRVSNLPEIALNIRKYVPDARIGIGHGQMKPEELEKIIMGFMNYDYDVLLSTTIVENGIDISNANTIIINDAHRFGLSDLHQMRGRVGRSNRKAFCYLIAPPLSLLSHEARKRLEALETFSDLGSGFNLSMQDLDIRGAGNLLGAEQSGFMEDLGFETYQKILTQAMAELRNEGVRGDDGARVRGDDGAKARGYENTNRGSLAPSNNGGPTVPLYVADCTIESDLEMYFSELYVPSSAERMLLYRELDNIKNDRDLELYKERLRDRFGEIPPEGLELLNVVTLRRLGKQLGCEKIMLKQGQMTLCFVSAPESPYYQSEAFNHVLNYAMQHVRQCALRETRGKRTMVVREVPAAQRAVAILQEIMA